MDSSIKNCLGTCEECYTLFEKNSGMISCGVWICSDRCSKRFERKNLKSFRQKPDYNNLIKITENRINN